MSLVVSTLARSVIEQTGLERSLLDAWNIELLLQTYKVNGVVSLLQKVQTPNALDVPLWMSHYKRPALDISNALPIFITIQILNSDFTWSLWSELVELVDDCKAFSDACYVAHKSGHASVAYALTVYKSSIRQQESDHLTLASRVELGRAIASNYYKDTTYNKLHADTMRGIRSAILWSS